MTAIEDGVRAWARGSYPLMAGVELLIRQGKAIYDGAPWIRPNGQQVWLDVEELLEGSGAWSGGEQRIVRIAASLLGGPAVDLHEDIPGLERDNAALVLAAISDANGSSEHSDVVIGGDHQARIVRLPALYPWPSETKASSRTSTTGSASNDT